MKDSGFEFDFNAHKDKNEYNTNKKELSGPDDFFGVSENKY